MASFLSTSLEYSWISEKDVRLDDTCLDQSLMLMINQSYGYIGLVSLGKVLILSVFAQSCRGFREIPNRLEII